MDKGSDMSVMLRYWAKWRLKIECCVSQHGDINNCGMMGTNGETGGKRPPDAILHSFNSSTWEAKAGGSTQVQDHPRPHSHTARPSGKKVWPQQASNYTMMPNYRASKIKGNI